MKNVINEIKNRGQPCDPAVKFAHSASWQLRVCHFRSQKQTQHCLPKAMAVVGIPRIKQRKMGMDVSSGTAFLSKKRKIGSSQLRANLPQKIKKKKKPLLKNRRVEFRIQLSSPSQQPAIKSSQPVQLWPVQFLL